MESYEFSLDRILNLDVPKLPSCDRITVNLQIAFEWQKFFIDPMHKIK